MGEIAIWCIGWMFIIGVSYEELKWWHIPITLFIWPILAGVLIRALIEQLESGKKEG